MILVASSLVCGCTSVLLRYDTSVELKDNKEIYYTFEKPLDISGTAVACYLTAIAYGGWCWAYLGVPFEADRKAFIAEAHDRLEDQLQGRWYMIGDERLTNESYFNTRYTSNLYNQNGDILELKPVERPKHKQVSLKLENEITAYHQRRERTMEHPNYTMFIYGDGGSDFSYHGSGIGVGYKWKSLLVDLGLGLVNRNYNLDNPWSFSINMETRPYFFGMGLSYFHASGVRDVEFSDRNVYRSGIEWEYIFTHASAGTYILQNARSNYQVTIELGIAAAIYEKYKLRETIDIIPGDEKPVALITGEDTLLTSRKTKSGVMAPFVRLALIYWLRSEN